MKPIGSTLRPRPMLAILLVSFSACTTLPQAVVSPPVIPPLPAQARQPAPPAWCQPTCSLSLSTALRGWLNTPMPPALQASSAPVTTRH